MPFSEMSDQSLLKFDTVPFDPEQELARHSFEVNVYTYDEIAAWELNLTTWSDTNNTTGGTDIFKGDFQIVKTPDEEADMPLYDFSQNTTFSDFLDITIQDYVTDIKGKINTDIEEIAECRVGNKLWAFGAVCLASALAIKFGLNPEIGNDNDSEQNMSIGILGALSALPVLVKYSKGERKRKLSAQIRSYTEDISRLDKIRTELAENGIQFEV